MMPAAARKTTPKIAITCETEIERNTQSVGCIPKVTKTTKHTWAGRHAMQQGFDHVFVVVDNVVHGYTFNKSIKRIESTENIH